MDLIFIVLLKILTYNKIRMKTTAEKIILSLILVVLTISHECQHDVISRDTPKHYLNDLTDGRLLQGSETGK